MRIRPHRSLTLVFLGCFIVPVVIMFMLTLWGVSANERATARVVNSYALNMAQSVADKVNNLSVHPFKLNRLAIRMNQENIFGWGPRLPGFITVMDSNGDVIVTSHSREERPKLNFPPSIVMNRSLQLTDDTGAQYSVAVSPTGGADSFYVVAAVRWTDLLGPVVRSNRLFVFLLVTIMFSLIAVLSLLWRCVIRPLKNMATEVENMTHEENLCMVEDRESVLELRTLRDVLCKLSRSVAEKVEALRNYTSDMVQVQEKEKERISREIHDGPVQTITALLQNIRLYRKFGEEKYLDTALDIGMNTVVEMRGMCDNLTPPWLDLGMENALTELAERMNKYLGVSVSLEGADVTATPEEVLTCYRLAQEAVSNAVKHGKATEVTLSLEELDAGLRMTISDNGKGFEVPDELSSLRQNGHRGLLNMRDRMRLASGDMEIISAPGEGTKIIYTFPPEKKG